MIKNYLKIAWRNLFRNKALSSINIFGLAIGMAFAVLIGLWVKQETTFDDFHANKDRIALVRRNTLFNNEKNTQLSMPLPLYDELKRNYPEVKRASRMDAFNKQHSLVVGNNKFNKRGIYVDPDFLKMFSFPLIQGSVETALKDPNSIVLAQSLAVTLFGKENPIGKTIKIDNQYDVIVTAIIKDVPKNSSVNFEFLAPFEFQVQNAEVVKNSKTQWGNNFLINVVEIKEGASMEALSKKIGPLVEQKRNDNKHQTLILQPLQKWHLYNEYKDWVNVGGRIDYVRLFAIIGIFVLLIACINFMNLTTARSEKRAREVGIRKAVGSQRVQLIAQFLGESMFTAFLAFLLSIALTQILLPYLKNVGFENIRFNLSDGSLLLLLLGVCIATGLIAGSYPALYLSSFLPVKVLKGTLKQGKGAIVFRKVLVVSQFTISIGLIVCTIIVFQQINHARDRFIGYDPNNLISIDASDDLRRNYNAFKLDLLNTGLIGSVAKASSPMTAVNNSWSDFSWEGKDPHANAAFDVIMTEWDYEKTVGLKFKQGRPFSREYKTDSNAIILNEAALKMIGYKDPVGRTIKYGDQLLTIVGVTENVIMRSPFKPVSATVILFNPDRVSTIFLKPVPNADMEKTLAVIQPLAEKYNPALPFEYSFVDEEFAKKFTTENQVGKLAGIFASLAIFISCLGLFGLAAFMAECRTKEIGIRKVLGASVPNLWMLLSKEYVLLVLLGCLIASPLTYWLMKDWLQKYEYRIDISWWVFAIAGLLAIVIALLTVSAQAIRAAVANPVKNLRTE